jgi:hypothetical protein
LYWTALAAAERVCFGNQVMSQSVVSLVASLFRRIWANLLGEKVKLAAIFKCFIKVFIRCLSRISVNLVNSCPGNSSLCPCHVTAARPLSFFPGLICSSLSFLQQSNFPFVLSARLFSRNNSTYSTHQLYGICYISASNPKCHFTKHAFFCGAVF